MANSISCRLCPRNCDVDRHSGHRGFCGQSNRPKLALATLHRGEEPPLCGYGDSVVARTGAPRAERATGSGAVFFTGCTLRCSFCQNFGISRNSIGREIDCEEMAQIFLELERKGAKNLNFVTGTHFLPGIAKAIKLAKAKNAKIPVVWNSSGYENNAGLDLIESFSNVYLPDLKTLDTDLSSRFFKAPDYPEVATAAVLRMVALSGPEFDEHGGLAKGTIVRHLVLPGYLENTRRVLEWYAENLSGRALLSIMFQFLPNARPGACNPGARPGADAQFTSPHGTAYPGGHARGGNQQNAPRLAACTANLSAPPHFNRTIEDFEYYAVIGMLEELGIEDGFIQEPEFDSPWLPDFDRDNPFPDEYSRVVWHWKYGFVGD